MKKNLRGTLLQLLLQLCLPCLKWFVSLWKSSRTMSRYRQVWSCKDGELSVGVSETGSFVRVKGDYFLESHRGSLPLLQWLALVSRFLQVYKNMLKGL